VDSAFRCSQELSAGIHSVSCHTSRASYIWGNLGVEI